MKTTLLLLWSLAGLPLQETCVTCQGGAGASSGIVSGGGNSMSRTAAGVSGAYGMSDGGSLGNGSGAGYGDFNSPCRNCNKGRCCKDSTCDMHQHYPYEPDNHGYYYFRPYNYTAVWKHQQWTATIGGDPRNPYSRALFIPVYEQFENTTYEPDSKPSTTLAPLPHVSRELPDLEKLIKRPDGDMPVAPTPADVPAPPAPQNN